MANDSTLLYEELRDAAHDNDACLHHDVMNRAAARISELEKTLADERRAHATELAHVAMSERETDAARIADLERRLTDSDDSHGRTIEQRDLLEEWADELHTALGCDHEASNLHDYFACIRHNALTLASHYESAEQDAAKLRAMTVSLEDNRVLAQQMARWVLNSPMRLDHACSRCVQDADGVVPGFVCGWHIAKHLHEAATGGS